MDLLGEEVIPVLRKEMGMPLRPAHVPEGPTHEALRAKRLAELMADRPTMEAAE